jgi:DMSO/TMAO reductase YedYZ molybdopterin-dependent catalytic subunit
MTRQFFALFAVLATAGVGLAGQSKPSPISQVLTVSGDVGKPGAFTLAELQTMPRSPMKVNDEKGRTAAYDGVLLAEVLRRAGVPSGDALTGRALSTYVLVTARDAYQVVFSLAEIDPAVGDANVLLADTMDGKAFPEALGPLRIIVPRDKHGSRWVTQVEKIEVVQVRK